MQVRLDAQGTWLRVALLPVNTDLDTVAYIYPPERLLQRQPALAVAALQLLRHRPQRVELHDQRDAAARLADAHEAGVAGAGDRDGVLALPTLVSNAAWRGVAQVSSAL
jgi:hypothetical protein